MIQNREVGARCCYPPTFCLPVHRARDVAIIFPIISFLIFCSSVLVDGMEDWVELFVQGVIGEDELDASMEAYARVVGNSERRVPLYRMSSFGKFDLGLMTDEDVVSNFRFRREDLPRLMRAFKIPNEITERGYRVPGITGLCMMLRRLAYPNRLSDLERLFGASGSKISTICTRLVKHIVYLNGHLLTDLRTLKWLNHERMADYVEAVTAKGGPGTLRNCWGFIDGTARKMCRPTVQQESFYSGHKRYHCLKYQSVMAPDGVIVSLCGPYEGRRHDAAILRMSALDEQLRAVCIIPTTNRKFVLYGDPAYPMSDVLISPFPTTSSDPVAAPFNKIMSSVRQAVEWGFAKIIRDFAFLDFSKNQKLLKQDLPAMFRAATLLTNCHTCLYGSQITQYFGILPPTLEEYLS